MPISFPNEEAFKTWVAAWIDSEGCISYPRVKGQKTAFVYYVSVGISNINPEPLQIIQSRFGGTLICQHLERQRPVFLYSIRSRAAIPLLKMVLPYLIVKRENAEIMIAHYRKKHRCCRNRKYPPEMWQQEEDVHQKMKELNHRPIQTGMENSIKARRQWWNNEDLRFLLENHDKMIAAEIGKKLNRTKKSIHEKISGLGLGDKMRKNGESKNDDEE